MTAAPDRPDWRQRGADYQASAAVAQALVGRLLRRLHAMECDRAGTTDIGPFMAGAVGALVEIVAETDMPMAELRAKLLQVFDGVAPQFEIERAHRRGGAVPGSEARQ